MAALRDAVERRLGIRLTTDRDYRRLSNEIFVATGEMLSATTIKRLWGYLDEGVTPRQYTLTLLSRYAGYSDWSSFRLSDPVRRESGPVGSGLIDVAADLRVADRLALRWHPGRYCLVEYMGGARFVILEAENSGLRAGVIFDCPTIIAGEPMYINIVEGGEPGSYVCGKQHGVTVERL